MKYYVVLQLLMLLAMQQHLRELVVHREKMHHHLKVDDEIQAQLLLNVPIPKSLNLRHVHDQHDRLQQHD